MSNGVSSLGKNGMVNDSVPENHRAPIVPKHAPVPRAALSEHTSASIAEKCFDIWGILKMASVKSVECGNNSFSVNHNIRCRSKLLLLGFSKSVLVLIL